MAQIAFGTSGWRGVLCRDFTFENVRKVTLAIARYLQQTNEAANGVVIGRDTRFMGKAFCEEAASVLAFAGIPVFLCDRDVPTPVLSFEVLRRGTAGCINFTASHNPPEYNGVKFSPSWGGPALPETTKEIERLANGMTAIDVSGIFSFEKAQASGLITMIDPRPAYLQDIATKVDLDAIRSIGALALNPLYGTARGYLDAPLVERHIPCTIINDYLDPYFGGEPPEPSEAHIHDFIEIVKTDPAIKLGLATDGDADRFGIVDGNGRFIEPNYIIALLLDYLITYRGLTGGVARSVATSHFVDAVAKKHGVEVFETPVGFKFIGELIAADKIVIGGEESAGLTIKGHVPEKDGIIACLLVAEMVAKTGKSVSELLESLYREVGTFITRRDNLRLSEELEAAYPAKVATPPSDLAGQKVINVVTIDGVKLVLADGSWVLFRKSGTEPVVRLYGEAATEEQLTAIMQAGRDFILS